MRAVNALVPSVLLTSLLMGLLAIGTRATGESVIEAWSTRADYLVGLFVVVWLLAYAAGED